MTTAPSLLGDAELEAAIRAGVGPSFWAARDPERAAVIDPVRGAAGDRTFAALDARANRLARGLHAAGLRAGDGIALLSRNRAEFCEVWAATNRAGLRLTPVNWHLTAEESAYVVDDCEAKAIVADASVAAVASGAAAGAPRAALRLAVGGAIDGFAAYDDFLAQHAPHALAEPSLGTSMLYTSGTTGRPRDPRRAGSCRTSTGAATSTSARARSTTLRRSASRWGSRSPRACRWC